MRNVWVIEPLRRGGFRCYEVTTFGDGSFKVSKPVVLQNALLFIDHECVELAELAEKARRSSDHSPSCSFSNTRDDAEAEGVGVPLTQHEGVIKGLRDRIVKNLPAVDIAQFDKLEDYVLALVFVG